MTFIKYFSRSESCKIFVAGIQNSQKLVSHHKNTEKNILFLGSLLIDEIKLSKAVRFNKSSGQFDGFKNLGPYKPRNKKSKNLKHTHIEDVADHALVFMLQPFKGKWVQTLGAFLTAGNCNGELLHLMVLDCLFMLENIGFKVDAVVCDGAPWNRSMFTKFGVSEENVSSPHPVDPERQLWFFSDFPHLVKTLRNWIVKQDEIMVRHFYLFPTINQLLFFFATITLYCNVYLK